MSKNYDNWERLVAAVLLREELRRVALDHSTNPSTITSRSSSFNSLFHDQLPVFYNNNGHNSHQLSAANFEAINNFNWDRFLPIDHQETTSRPASLSISLDERTGKKSYMVGARDLKISLSRQNWKWRFDADSRFSEVAELQSAWRLDIRAKIRTRMLQPWTVYAAYLVFKVADTAEGVETAKGMIRFVNDESDRDATKRAQIVHLQPTKDAKGETAVEGSDGWMEVEMGNFYVGQGDDGEVEARLLEMKKWKTGLIVEGIVFRPTDTYIEAPLVSKQYMSTNVWG